MATWIYTSPILVQIPIPNDDSQFIDISQASATDDTLWGSSCAFADYDRDGDLDLYVANYVSYALTDANRDNTPYMSDMNSYDSNTEKGYPHPANFPGSPDRLFRNDGTGVFEDVSEQANIYDEGGKGVVRCICRLRSGWMAGRLYCQRCSAELSLSKRTEWNLCRRSPKYRSCLRTRWTDGSRNGRWIGDYDGDSLLDITVTKLLEAEPTNSTTTREIKFLSIETFTSGTE